MVTQFPSLNFHHSSLITHHSNFHIHLLSSSNFYHSIFFTLFMDPTTVTVSNHFCFVTRVQFSSPSVFLFFLFPLPLQPCLSPKAETQTQKNVSTSLASSVASSLVNNAQVSDMYNGAISPSWPISQWRRRATTPTSPISPFCHGRSPPTQGGASLPHSAQLRYSSVVTYFLFKYVCCWKGIVFLFCRSTSCSILLIIILSVFVGKSPLIFVFDWKLAMGMGLCIEKALWSLNNFFCQ